MYSVNNRFGSTHATEVCVRVLHSENLGQAFMQLNLNLHRTAVNWVTLGCSLYMQPN